jgi:glycogen synthase
VNPDAPLFAFIGRLEEQKGADILLAAIPKIVAQVPNAQVRHDGGGTCQRGGGGHVTELDNHNMDIVTRGIVQLPGVEAKSF